MMNHMTQKEDNKTKPLTLMELHKLASLYKKMSKSAKDSFICMMLMKHEENFAEIITFLGKEYIKNINRA